MKVGGSFSFQTSGANTAVLPAEHGLIGTSIRATVTPDRRKDGNLSAFEKGEFT